MVSNCKRPATVLAAAMIAASTLAACGGSDAPKLTFQGMAVKDADKSLSNFEQNWRAHLATSETKMRIADDAKCLYQVVGKEISSKLLCGPFRAAGSDATSWSSAEVAGYPTQDGKGAQLTLDSAGEVDWDDSATPLPNATAMTAAGKKANVTETVDEPDAPQVASGTAMVDSDSDGMASSDVASLYATDGGLWTVSTSTPKPGRYAGSGQARRQAPAGSVLLRVSIAHEETDVSQANPGNQTAAAQATEKETTLSVTSGGRTVNLTKPDASGKMSGSWIVSVPGDGKDAKVNVTAAGGTQTVTLFSKVVSGVAAGWSPDDSGNGVTKQPLTQETDCTTGSDGIDWSNPPKNHFTNSGLDCSVKWSVAPYVKGKGWAPQGSQWWQVFVAASVSDLKWWDADSTSTDYSAKATATSASIDGQKDSKPETITLQSSWGGESTTYQMFTFTVKNGAYPTSLTLTATASGVPAPGSTSGGPKTWSDDKLTGSVQTN